jgi:hypothetical protein
MKEWWYALFTREHLHGITRFKECLSIGCTAWNICVFPKETRDTAFGWIPAVPATFHMCSSHDIRFKPQWLCTTQVQGGRTTSSGVHQANISVGSAENKQGTVPGPCIPLTERQQQHSAIQRLYGEGSAECHKHNRNWAWSVQSKHWNRRTAHG